jgi:hypothetical protein
MQAAQTATQRPAPAKRMALEMFIWVTLSWVALIPSVSARRNAIVQFTLPRNLSGAPIVCIPKRWARSSVFFLRKGLGKLDERSALLCIGYGEIGRDDPVTASGWRNFGKFVRRRGEVAGP